ncbi:carboxypeptidase-like regulatory domain-containing protein, partial [Granulicella sp. S156]|uniref:carboxypeptidase-like regulatory domain-containing protein n=1 Tax=Granulicella sp. S156 TaxID=1747224 RepID=UPI001C2034AC
MISSISKAPFDTASSWGHIYTVSILPSGQYRVQVSKIGFKTLIKPGIVLNVQSAVAINFTLPIGATSESVTVEAGSSMLNTTDATVGTVVDRKFVANIPLNGRSFQDLISMTPGVVTQSPQAGSSLGFNGDFSVNGQRTESN